MRKSFKAAAAVCLASAMVFSFTACGTSNNTGTIIDETAETSETDMGVFYESVSELVNAGYIFSQSSWDDESEMLTAEFITPDHSSFYFVSIDATQEDWDEFNEINADPDASEEEIDAAIAEFFDNANGLYIYCADEDIPTDDAFSDYVGQTIADLEGQLDTWGITVNDDGYYVYLLYDQDYIISCTTDMVCEDESVVPEDTSAITVTAASFYEFSIG